jgi:transcription antitermination factor NusG
MSLISQGTLISQPTFTQGTPEMLAVSEWSEPEVGSWFVLRTRSRQEKVISRDLDARGVVNYLPLVTCTKFYGGRKARVQVPLFPGYVFLRGSLDDAYTADRTNRVAQILHVKDQHRLDWELHNIHIALDSEASLDPFPYLRAGVRVEVRSGPFRGLQGIIEDRTRRDRLILQVETLGQAVSIEIDGSLLDVID